MTERVGECTYTLYQGSHATHTVCLQLFLKHKYWQHRKRFSQIKPAEDPNRDVNIQSKQLKVQLRLCVQQVQSQACDGFCPGIVKMYKLQLCHCFKGSHIWPEMFDCFFLTSSSHNGSVNTLPNQACNNQFFFFSFRFCSPSFISSLQFFSLPLSMLQPYK